MSKYIVEIDGKINGYFEELSDAVHRHSQLDGAKIYKVITWRTTITEVDDQGNDLVVKSRKPSKSIANPPNESLTDSTGGG